MGVAGWLDMWISGLGWPRIGNQEVQITVAKHFQRKCSHCIHFGEMGKWGNGEWVVGCGSGAAVPACSNACKQDLTIKF